MFGMNPKGIFKLLRTMGVKVRFDQEQKALIIDQDGTEQIHYFADIEKMVNGDE